ncbi:hypothetical protein GE09DRAFT_137788 [Coniochaeta sp. 2T2.1]|nr:hypothetical protein GE09DRAFT_137788 [Coniochaeta sp. 2T2.1]
MVAKQKERGENGPIWGKEGEECPWGVWHPCSRLSTALGTPLVHPPPPQEWETPVACVSLRQRTCTQARKMKGHRAAKVTQTAILQQRDTCPASVPFLILQYSACIGCVGLVQISGSSRGPCRSRMLLFVSRIVLASRPPVTHPHLCHAVLMPLHPTTLCGWMEQRG